MAYFTKNKCCAFFILLIFLFSCKKDKINVNFTEVSSPTTCQLDCIKMIDTVGFACGGRMFDKSELIRTLDGGATWHKIPLPIQGVENKRLFSLDFLPTGQLQVVGFGGVTYQSDNFATDIHFQQEPRWAHWTSICYRTPNHAMACGQHEIEKGYIAPIESTDNWTYPWLMETYSFGMNHIAFPDSNHGFIAGFGAIYKTNDGGNHWEFTEAKNDNFTATEWFSINEGVAVGWEGSILRTTNGGEDWDIIRKANKLAQKRIHLKGLAKSSNNTLIALGENGCILLSHDQGQNWKELERFTAVHFESASFQNANTFFAVGNDGRIFKVQL